MVETDETDGTPAMRAAHSYDANEARSLPFSLTVAEAPVSFA